MAGTPNVGTLVGAAIRPINSADLISTAYANEIKGGIHGYATLSERDNIIIERRQWGMLVTVYNDPIQTNNKTYQLKYNNVDDDLMNVLNWVEYTGVSSTNISEWQNSVKSILTTVPTSPNDGDRYLVGIDQSSTIIGSPWAGNPGGFISQYNSTTTNWTNTIPTNGMTIRVDDQDNSLYKYEGDYSTGQWIKEKLTQVYSVDFTGNGLSYSTTTSPTFSQYENDIIFLSKFDVSNTANVSVNINGIGVKLVKKPSINGLVDLLPNDIIPENIYTLSYDYGNDYFQFYKNYSNDTFNIKYYIEPNDYIVVPPYCQYWVYGDLTVDGTIVNYGKIIIANGELIIGTSGVVQNNGDIELISIATENQPVFNSIIVGGPTSSGGVVISATGGNLTINDINIKPYKVYTALLTQSGSDGTTQGISASPLIVGATYYIEDNGGSGWDFTNVGAPNNDLFTYFVATGETPNSWGINGLLGYTPGAPVVTVLENTIGNIWFEYGAVGYYSVKSDLLFKQNKTTAMLGSVGYDPADIAFGFLRNQNSEDTLYILTRDNGNVDADDMLIITPIEIRVYN